MSRLQPETYGGSMEITLTMKEAGDQCIQKVLSVEVGSSGELQIIDSKGQVCLIAAGQWLMLKAKDE